ncbi:protein LNK3-like isoform X2 [Cynara cardunculus var. scolymus]|uniref:protein LNK3-like isoform X2 n=1 Tax=Cynara cardunculus var. scolymus TaxID=59895 RepID=UPI000D630201|nr:protein LNK3-like isoform X2 [Cynara cardunculus var. scolymus]
MGSFRSVHQDIMEWYFGNEVEDLVVPKDYEQPEMISSPESWSQWGINAFGGSDFPKKNYNSNANANMTREELTFNGGKNFYTSIDMDDSNNGRQKSNNSSMNQGLYNNGGSLLWNDQADFQQFTEEEARINHMDDLFFSLLEEDPTKDSTESHDNTMLDNNVNIFKGEMVSSQNVGSHGQNTGSSKYLKTHAFSPSNDWSNEVSTPYEMPEQYTNDENSMEESVLKDLERVTALFTDKTRICFRDAFYRLAESSKQSVNSCQDGEPMMTSNDDTLRSGETEVSESKTNVIDRAVASLMFNKFDYEDNDHQTDYEDDAEVPIGGMHELAQSTAH